VTAINKTENTETPHHSDEHIAKSIQEGKKDNLAILIDRYEEKLTRYVSRMIFDKSKVEDLTQDVFINAYTNINSFNVKQKFNPWIYRIAHNICINEIKKSSRWKILDIDSDTILPFLFAKERTETNYEKDEIRKEMAECLEKLDTKYKEAIMLYYYEEMSYDEISDVLKIPTSTVGIRIKRAKEKIKNIYTEKYGTLQ
jgi:RNA polymerase sigma-70 factor (ECF subfamily)